MKAIHYLLFLSASVFVFNSCTKDVAGPAGPTGPPGSSGASAQYYVTIDSVDALSTLWVQNTSGAANYYQFIIDPVQGLTTPNNSVVEVYYSQLYNTYSQWYEFPIANALQVGDAFNFSYSTSKVFINYYSSSQPGPKLYFKVIVITPP